MADNLDDAASYGLRPVQPGAAVVPVHPQDDPASYGLTPVAAKPAPAASNSARDSQDPTGAAADMGYRPGPANDPTAAIHNALMPAPNTTYSDVLPLAKDDKTGDIRLALPNFLRSPLIGLTEQGPQIDPSGKLVVPGATIDPATNTLGVTPETAAMGALAVPEIRGVRGTPVPPLSPEAARVAEVSAAARQPPPPQTVPTLSTITDAIRRADRPAGPTPESPAEAGPAGAQVTPPREAALTPREADINRSNAEQQKLLERQEPGVPDNNIYVEGNHPTEAEIEQTVHAAREMKNLRNVNVDVSQSSRELADQKSQNRQGHYADIAGSQFDKLNAETARDQQLSQDIGAVFRNKTEADAQGVVDVGNAILDGPDGKVDPVVRVVKNVLGKLTDRTGQLESDPEKLWGVRKQINLLLSKEAAIENPTNQAAVRQLMQLRNAVDAAIEPAAPGFHAALQRYAEASRPIDAMELLQGRESRLYDNQNRMQYSSVQRMLKEAVAARHPDAPLNPWKSLSDEQMQRLFQLRDDLRRSASAEDLARAGGSDTVPNAVDVAKSFAGTIGSSLPILGPMGLRAKAALDPLIGRYAAAKQQRRGMEMLYPDPARYPPRNALGPP